MFQKYSSVVVKRWKVSTKTTSDSNLIRAENQLDRREDCLVPS